MGLTIDGIGCVWMVGARHGFEAKKSGLIAVSCRMWALCLDGPYQCGGKMCHATATDVEVSVIVPTINEGHNLRPLVSRISAALGDWKYEILVIDDGSTDDTTSVCDSLAKEFPLRLHVRLAAVGGLSGAVLDGFARARGRLLV